MRTHMQARCEFTGAESNIVDIKGIVVKVSAVFESQQPPAAFLGCCPALMAATGVEYGKEYPLLLGDSMQGQPADLCYMRYDFKPASAHRQGMGHVSISNSEVMCFLKQLSTCKP